MHDLGIPTNTKFFQENLMLVDQSWMVYRDSYQAPISNLASYTKCIPGLAISSSKAEAWTAKPLKHTKSWAKLWSTVDQQTEGQLGVADFAISSLQP